MRILSLVAVCGGIAIAGTAHAGTVNGVSASPRTTITGTTITVTVTGTSPCGAAHIIFGDDAAVTYAIDGLPTSQTHVYGKAGTYTITARGMGNCDGEATTTVTVSGPAAPASPPAEITAVDMAPTPGRIREPVTVTVNGKGSCGYEVQYGDGNAQEASGTFPKQIRHTYAQADRYTVIVKAIPPCHGTFTQLLQVIDPASLTGRVARVVLAPTPAAAGQPVTITVEGATGCGGYTLDFGDGNTEARSAALPDVVRHVYPSPGRYVVSAIATTACTGQARTPIEVRRGAASASPRLARIVVSPATVDPGQTVTITVEGAGACQGYTLDYGDGNSEPRSATLPDRAEHVYRVAGRYILSAAGSGSCAGEVRAPLDVRGRRQR
ncbi:MAG: hypothetical protein ABI818_05550 [Acidobacteriota bacterium]